jgi:hypothetical protein
LLKSANKIMLPVSGNILLYDISCAMHSDRLKIIYNSTNFEDDEKVGTGTGDGVGVGVDGAVAVESDAVM